MSIPYYSFSGWRTPVNFVIIRSSSLCLMDCNQSELDPSLRRAKVSAKWAWVCLVPRLALLTFDGSRGTRVMGKFQRRKGTGEDATWRLKQRFPPLLSQSNSFFHQLRICCPLWPNHIAPSFSNVFVVPCWTNKIVSSFSFVFRVHCWANQITSSISCVFAVFFEPIKFLPPSAVYLAPLAEPIKLLPPSALYLVSLAEPTNYLSCQLCFGVPC